MFCLYLQAMQAAGVDGEQVYFILEDYQLINPEYLDLINSLLSSGEVCVAMDFVCLFCYVSFILFKKCIEKMKIQITIITKCWKVVAFLQAADKKEFRIWDKDSDHLTGSYTYYRVGH